MAKNRKHGTEFKLQIIEDNSKGWSIAENDFLKKLDALTLEKQTEQRKKR